MTKQNFTNFLMTPNKRDLIKNSLNNVNNVNASINMSLNKTSI